MPPILLLKGDNQFYGSIKPPGERIEQNSFNGNKPVLPPNPMSNTALTTSTSRKSATIQLENLINNPTAPIKKNLIKEDNLNEINIRNLDKLNSENDLSLGQKFTNFLQNPIIETNDIDNKKQKEREKERIIPSLKSNEIKNQIRPIGEVPQKTIIQPAITAVGDIYNFTEDKVLKFIGILGAIYLLGEYIKK